ncbi:MAG: cation:proton antiporter [Nitrospina sp.]|jgi:glutathione-regulated potassium-efflux system ancillary protein KefC|nr:cation:proton antiporter [Nitrospina sp.]MBT3877393.1 cation:proton antiporter [Nitrospina sp.]MBT4046736.1 cation:proton antiporter [Nitrospina sp.]MBT4557542.1 cation:proton antiporter [Nitrospina sp.]MBT5349583.1 cation:proton antiporter [Nitrospina sp.]
MDFEWVAIALSDVSWISLAFILGFLARLIGLPPLVGFLGTGFVLNSLGFSSGEMLQKLSDLGITLLLFAVGLKLNLKTLIRPQVWLVSTIHMTVVIVFLGTVIFCLALMKAPLFSGLDFKFSMMLAFALSFSSTVFAVKALEEKGQIKSLHGRISIGILVMQDLAAVIFLATSMGKFPSLWAPLLILLIPLRPLFHYFLRRTGHGELMILYGFVLAMGGAELFELAGIKDDLGALFMGVLISSYPKSKELAKSMLGFKDLFLVGFFLSIGMSGQISAEVVIIGLLLVPFIFIKTALFYFLMTRFKLRSRTSLLTSLNLTNYSEFGLIVAAIGVAKGWIIGEWLIVIAIALSISFVVGASLTRKEDRIYQKYRNFWLGFQSKERLPDDEIFGTFGATIAIFGMGRVGTGAYDKMHELKGKTVVGIDFDSGKIKLHQSMGRKVLQGDPGDADFWEKVEEDHKIELVMLALPNLQANLDALGQLMEISFSGRIAATARYPDEEERLYKAGATAVFNIYTEAGTGFADHVVETNHI